MAALMTELQQRACEALAQLEGVIIDALRGNPTGYYNNEIARLLNLESDYEGRQANYLTYSVLGGLLKKG